MDMGNFKVTGMGGKSSFNTPKEGIHMLNPNGRRYLSDKDQDILANNDQDDIVIDVYKALRKRIISPRAGAKAIVFRLRTDIVAGIRKHEDVIEFKDTETLRYLDTILFDGLEFLIESHIDYFFEVGRLYGSNDDLCTKEICKKNIKAALEYMDYGSVKTTPIFKFIDHIYEIFS